MEVNKEQFRELVESGNIGSALNRLSDVSHFLEEAALREQLDEVAGRFQAYLEAKEAGKADPAAMEAVKSELLTIIDRMPEHFSAAGPFGQSGCLGALLLVVIGLTCWLA